MSDAYDLCIVGAGLAGLNALFVASQYLSPDQRVLLIDRRHRPGGMWVDTYDHVRLHQPYHMFTAGNIGWRIDRDRGYLATKPEVLDQLQHCLEVLRGRLRIDEMFGWTMDSADEADDIVRVDCHDEDGQRRTIGTKQLIKAYGYDIHPLDALPISSSQVRSVSANTTDVRSGPISASDTPLWVVGGGKTAMDTAHALITTYPGREVNLIAGPGTFFIDRDKALAAGARRWWTGSPLSRIVAETSRRFDGTNENEVARWFRTTYGIGVTVDAANYRLGFMSEEEHSTVSSGLHNIAMDRFVDVVDDDNGPLLVLARSARQPVTRDSWIINCGGYLDQTYHPYEPYASASGNILSIQTRSATMHLTSFMAYFLTHLMFLGKIRDVPLYELDMPDLRRRSVTALPFTMFSLAQYNLGLIFDHVPTKVLRDCGLDLDLWYPLPRRLLWTARFVLHHRRERPHLQRTLDTISERFDVRCGPLEAPNRR